MSTAADTLNPYAKFLEGQDPLAVLPNTPGRLKSLAQAIGPAKINTPQAPGKWSPRDIFCHLADCETVFAFRLRQTLAEDHHQVQPFDQDKWAARYSGVPAAEALAAFSALRNWNLRLIRDALPAAAGRMMTHPERGTMTFQSVVETMAGHDLNHLGQLRKIVGHG